MTTECGELVLQNLFLDFVRSADRRIESSLTSDYENELHRQFQRGRDTEFDRLLCALGRMAEFCLSSLIRHALDWRQMKIEQVDKTDRNSKRIEGIEYVFCHLIIESLQVPIPRVPGTEAAHGLALNHFLAIERTSDTRTRYFETAEHCLSAIQKRKCFK